MQILVLGAGGVGGYAGIRMLQAGQAVRFLLRQRTAQIVRERGLKLESPKGHWAGPVDVVESGQIDRTFGIIVLACKAYDLDTALEAMAPAGASGTVIIPFLNGIRHLERIRDRFPQCDVWGGVAHIGAASPEPGRIVHLNDLQTFLIGKRDDAKANPEVETVLSSAASDAFQVELRPDIVLDMWEKWSFLATFAGITCAMRQDIGTILETKAGGGLIEALYSECLDIAKAEGFSVRPEAEAFYRTVLFKRGSKSTASMLRDIVAGNRTEHEHVLGDLLERAGRHGIEAPVLTLCATHVEAYGEPRRARTEPGA